MSESQQAAVIDGERQRDQSVTQALVQQANRDRFLLPHRDELVRSEQRRLQVALRPKSLIGFVNWAKFAYRQEPPTRLHDRDTAKDGAPRWTGDFMAWLNASEGAACGLDDEGAFRTPFRCAVYTLHGKLEDTPEAAMADLALDVAALTLTWDVIAGEHGVNPHWVRRLAVEHALARLWDTYTPQPR